MRIISRRTLVEYWHRRPETKKALSAWYTEITNAPIKGPAHLKDLYGSASFIANNRVVFNICGNKHRLIVAMNKRYTIGFVKFVGTHKEYDEINAESI